MRALPVAISLLIFTNTYSEKDKISSRQINQFYTNNIFFEKKK